MSKGTSKDDLIISASAIPVAGADGQPVTRMRLLPAGTVKLKDGRGPYRCDPARVVAAAQAYWAAEDMPLDYDHQTLSTKDGKGGTAPASAWIKPARLTAEADGVYANDIEWTAEAAAAITGKKYKYFSPLFGASKTGEVTGLYGGGLTNDPAIGGLTVIAASSFHPQKETEMNLSALAVGLGLPADATLDQISAAQKAQAEKLTAASTALGIKPEATTEEIVAAGAALKTDPKKVAGANDVIVPASAWNDTQARLAALETDRVAASVDALIAEGKIVPASRDTSIAWATRDPENFAKHAATLPVIVAAGAQNGGKPADAKHGLTEQELVAASALGMTPEAYAKGKE